MPEFANFSRPLNESNRIRTFNSDGLVCYYYSVAMFERVLNVANSVVVKEN